MQKRQVVDTSAWIEWMARSEVGLDLVQEFPEPEQCIVPTMVLLELAKWVHRESDDRDREDVLDIATACHVQPLDQETALLAAQYWRSLGLATADSTIYATARRLDAELITCDADFKDLPGVRYYPKIPASGVAGPCKMRGSTASTVRLS